MPQTGSYIPVTIQDGLSLQVTIRESHEINVQLGDPDAGIDVSVEISDNNPINVTFQNSLATALAYGDIQWMVSPIETPDGSNKRFTLPAGQEYVSGRIAVFRSGVMHSPGMGITEISSTQFDFDDAPDADEQIALLYIKQ